MYILHEVLMQYLVRDVDLEKSLGLQIEIWESLTN